MRCVGSARPGALKVVLPLEGSVVASDALLPDADTVDALAKRGKAAVIRPGDSRRDCEAVEAADRLRSAMLCTGMGDSLC